mgnify:CR=1 FL=1
MTLIENTERILLPNGTYIARCNLVADIGEQQQYQTKEQQAKNEPLRYAPQIVLGWEIFKLDESGKNYLSNCRYNRFFSEKAKLRLHLESWISIKQSDLPFNVDTLINKPAQVTSALNERRTWANVVAVTGLPEGVDAPELTTEPLVYNVGDKDVYDKLPQWIQNQIDKSETVHFQTDEDIPF